MSNPNDAVRDAILRHLYSVHTKARSPKSAGLKITELGKALKPLKLQEVGSNLDYLVRIAPGCGVQLMASFNSGRLWRRSPGPASVRSCSRSFSTLRRGLGSRRCARTRGDAGNTRNIRRAFPARENTICIRSPRKCLCPSARGLDTSSGNRAPNTFVGPVPRAP